MVLVDTNIWINHFRKGDPELVARLNLGSVAIHPFVIGELACGNLQNREEILNLLHCLPSIPEVDSSEYLEFIESRKLMGKGLGFVDVHLLASTVLAGIVIWTGDKRLEKVAGELDVSY